MPSNQFLVPLNLVNLTTAQRDSIVSPSLGDTIFNTDNLALESYDASGWTNKGSNVKSGITGFMPSAVPNSLTLLFQTFDLITTFPIGVPNSVITCINAPTGNVTLNISKILSGGGTSLVGTLNLFTGNTTGTVTFGAEVICAVGDSIKIDSAVDMLGTEGLFLNLIGFSKYPIY